MMLKVIRKRYNRVVMGGEEVEDDNRSLPSQGSVTKKSHTRQRRDSQDSPVSNNRTQVIITNNIGDGGDGSPSDNTVRCITESRTLAFTTGPDRDAIMKKRDGSRSPKRASPSRKSDFIRVRDASFDFDDDDESIDDIPSMKDYNIEFTHSYEADSNDNPRASPVTTTTPALHTTLISTIWFAFQSVRQEARHRRAQRLLEEVEDTWQRQTWMCLMTSCDATDRGIAIVATFIIFWGILVWETPNPALQRHLATTGVLLFAIRVSARPMYNYFQAIPPERIGEIKEKFKGKTNQIRSGIQSLYAKDAVVGHLELSTIDEGGSQSHQNHDPTVHCV